MHVWWLIRLLDDDIEYSSNNKVVKSEIGKEEMKMTVYFKYLVSYLTAETKAVHRSMILSSIMEFRRDMEMRSKVFPSDYEPYIVEINYSERVKLKDKSVFEQPETFYWPVTGQTRWEMDFLDMGGTGFR